MTNRTIGSSGNEWLRGTGFPACRWSFYILGYNLLPLKKGGDGRPRPERVLIQRAIRPARDY